MVYKAIRLSEKLEKFSDYWSPRIIARLNDYHFKLVKLKGEFVWHRHSDTDEAFIVLKGKMKIQFRDGQVLLEGGDMFIVPRGKEHRPVSDDECQVLLIEPSGVINTGDAGGSLTAANDVWI